MQQIIVIHGATTFNEYEDYLESLRTKSVDIERLKNKPLWKERLQATLGNDYEVLLPNMPNKTNARYSEWKAWFDNISTLITDDCILIGHSMGAVFLAKYLSENQFPHSIVATILVAAPYDDETEEDLGDFKLKGVSEQFTAQAGHVTLFFGEDDPVINPVEIDKYRQDLPAAAFVVMSAPDHFNRQDFPELIKVIQSQNS